MILSLLTALMVKYVARFQTSLAQSMPMIAGVCVLIFTTLILGTVLNQTPWNALDANDVHRDGVDAGLQSAIRLDDDVCSRAGPHHRAWHDRRSLADSHGGHGDGHPLTAACADTHPARAGILGRRIGLLRHQHCDGLTDITDLGIDADGCVPLFRLGHVGGLSVDRVAAGGRALLQLRDRHQLAGTRRRLASAVAGTGAASSGNLHAQHDRGDVGRGIRGSDRRQSTAGAASAAISTTSAKC